LSQPLPEIENGPVPTDFLITEREQIRELVVASSGCSDSPELFVN